jgi:Triphosphoribosyl-dephospho-CoA synthetase
MTDSDFTAEKISAYASFAMISEAAAYPKPGNVHRLKDFKETHFEHFLASAASVQPVFQKIAKESANAESKNPDQKNGSAASFGAYFEEAVENSRQIQAGGNTHFGTLLLLLPIAAAAGKLNKKTDRDTLLKTAHEICRNTTEEDAVCFYNAFCSLSIPVIKAGKNNELEYDLTDAALPGKIKENNVSLFDLMERGAKRDMISAEWATGFEKSKLFAEKFQKNKKRFEKKPKTCFRTPFNSAAVYTFMEFLAEYPDTFISTKFDEKAAIKVQKKAARIMKNKKTGKKNKNLRKMIPEIEKLDEDLRKKKMNPGSIADITAAGIFIALSEGTEI